ncbi:MAG: hypothetical protein JNM25_12365 [Planctomycetes bacterium]|nr:hypothetical protein [Planctomycetota bacterium]
MNWLPQSLAGRLLVAFVVAAAGIAVLAVSVRERDQARAAHRRAAAAPAPPPPPALGIALAPCGGRVLLASRIEAVPPGVAPVVEVFADGSAALRRPGPLALAPGGGDDRDAAVLLPRGSLAELSPAARAAVLDLVGQLVAGRPVPPARIRLVDVGSAGAELGRLLQWVP